MSRPKILLITGVENERTPVLQSFINYYEKEGFIVELIEYSIQSSKFISRLKFIFKSLYSIFFKEFEQLIFVGIQTLPILFISQCFFKTKNAIYWSLESYNVKDGNSLILKLLVFEKFISWNYITLLLPIEERLVYHTNFKYRNTYILPNLPNKGTPFIKRTINKGGHIHFVFYGNLDQSSTYLIEFINFVKHNRDKFKLDIIGNSQEINKLVRDIPNIFYRGPLGHACLMQALRDNYHFSIVGYRPINFNTLNCAPNKFYESISLSLPIIGNRLNPTIKRVISQTKAGLYLDFSRLPSELYYDKILQNYSFYNENAYFSYLTNLNFENFISKIDILKV